MRRPEDEQEEDDRLTRNLAGLAFVLLLLVVGLYLVRELAQSSRTQDCVMSGRRNCAPIDTRSAAR
jgi:hypothetical protein